MLYVFGATETVVSVGVKSYERAMQFFHMC